MNRIIVLAAVLFALSACGAIPLAPKAVDMVPENPSGDKTEAIEVKATTEQSGLGTIAYDGTTRTQPCGKQRRTGSHIFQTECDDPDSGSQPVRYGTWNDLGKYAMSGSVRPEK